MRSKVAKNTLPQVQTVQKMDVQTAIRVATVWREGIFDDRFWNRVRLTAWKPIGEQVDERVLLLLKDKFDEI